MKIPFVYGPNDLRLCDVEKPKAGPGDVVINVGVAGICGSDLGFVAMGGLLGPGSDPMPLGHELAGTVVEVGAVVSAFAIGDRVVLNPLINMVGNGAPEGGFGEQLLIRDVASKPESLLHLPENISMEVGALIEPLAVATHAVNQMGVKAGDKVAIYGAGPIGLAAIVVLHYRCIQDIVVFDLSPFRRDRALELGARTALDPREKNPSEALLELHGEVEVFRSPAPQTTHFLESSGAPVLPEIIGYARTGAKICVVSLQKEDVPVSFRLVMAKELVLIGALGYPTEFEDVLMMLKDGNIDLEAYVSHRFDGADFMEAFETAKQQDKAAKVLVKYTD